MEALKFKTLTQESEIETYLEKFEGFVGVKLPYDYSMRSRIVSVYKGDTMVGGYMLVTKPTFRSLMFVPDSVKSSHPFFQNDQYEMMEVNGVWISASVKSALEQYRIWTHMMWDVFTARKKYILLMADLRNTNIRNIHNMTNPETLYEGAPMLMAGTTSHDKIRVSVTTRWQMLMNMPKYYLAYRDRVRRSSKRAKGREFNRMVREVQP
ncbi:MAG: hypothetical protein KDI28_00795 [Pseudomonadales bacterium]|nr:hypothetical protein [Pseudomonadales bacterium]MCP5358676.1 hypothetical protein [Pseudomonadales bacterium]